MRDLYHNVLATQVLSPATVTTAQTSSAIDMQGYNSASVVFAIGHSGDTLSGSLFWTLKLQHSDSSGSGYSDTATTDINAGVATIVIDGSTNADSAAYSFGYIGGKRYLKAVATPTGSVSSGVPVGIIALRGTPAYKPVV